MDGGARSGEGRMPDFLLIGAMKAGTTTLWSQLARHPAVFMCTPKEPQFWSRDPVRARGIAWYQSLFAKARPDQRTGEASTCYSRWPHFGDVAGRIAEALPDVKLIYLLRHPVDRAYSHYGHLMEERAVQAGGPIASFEEAIETLPEIIDSSLYMSQIEQFLARFPRNAIHVTLLDDLLAHPEATWNGIQDFLEIPRAPLGAKGLEVANPSGTGIAGGMMRSTLNRLRRGGVASRGIDLLPVRLRRGIRRWLQQPEIARRVLSRRIRSHRRAVSTFEPATRRELLRRLEEPTRALEAFLGRDLPQWHR